ncbi:membrane component of an ABC superfamily predicted amino-acid transporter [Wigglesworthia glossinidia endosymbiont of Glossina morsitans morsitans (Yale colony)]|uniref:Membrane component of an ABC superfamily predicted amino-acid transporter n=1 Tax=Wigglesworthia glossinidia endosymbiont of Glossina morsitans morsitans (Yale colony) TaxID=1142511 RepID=H6Q5C5_WIGGL|nr:ABC transporter permease subunit [Wigglesworthia glossinidia]AFA41410.1 membrane component of an ABC superfamily predicted amino-acid transporter [Wigglesworthia glossinidia endosymbiont of Glossina morsitans morsitans (Yale colony)]
MHFQWSVILENISYFIFGNTFFGEPGGLFLTFFITVIAGIFSILLGILLAMLSWCIPKIFKKILFFISEIIRGIPLIFIIFWMYFIFPFFFSNYISREITIIFSLIWFNSSAVMHIILSGIYALPKGQHEAGLAEGLSNLQIFCKILLPQAIKNSFPSWNNLIINLVKDTSLAFILNVPELTTVGSQLNNVFQVYSLEIFLFVAFLYYMLCKSFEIIVKYFLPKIY